jgi:uncharacterized protein (DUF2252 family)
MARNVWERIQQFNKDRNPERLRLKYQLMRQNSFVFFRGTCHLFYEDWLYPTPLDDVPPVWICGDLHLQNFGSYKGDNRLVYFDMNDFDESALAPATWELGRFLTSVLVGTKTLNLNELESEDLCRCFLRAYAAALVQGKARVVEDETAEGMVKDLLDGVKERKRKDFLDKRSETKSGQRRLFVDNKHVAPITDGERSHVEAFLTLWGSKQSDPGFYRLLDVAHRIAGVGSLGVDRYLLLVEGKGSPDQNYFLDLKEETVSSLRPYLPISQPTWLNEAERVVAIQGRVQGTCPALLSAVVMGGKAYVLRELQPDQDKVDWTNWNGKLRQLEGVIAAMGEITAWDQLRSSGRQGSSIADDLIAFSRETQWQDALLLYAKNYAKQVEEDYREFCNSSVT